MVCRIGIRLAAAAAVLSVMVPTVRGFSTVARFSAPRLSPAAAKSVVWSSLGASALEDLATMSNVGSSGELLLLAKITQENLGQVTKSAFIVLLFGGGLIPAAIAANKSLIGTLTGKRRGGEQQQIGDVYVQDSGARGPTLPNSAFLFASEKIPLVDIIAIVGRIKDVNSLCDWRALPTAQMSSINPDKPIMWLPRSIYKENIRKAKFVGWPLDATSGLPVGGKELENLEKARISKTNALIGDAALDAVFDSWAWGASIATPDKVQAQLADWRRYEEEQSFDMDKFTRAAARGRAITGLGALTFIVLQAVAYGTLFIAPTLRVFFDIDIGLGQMGSCDGECIKLL